MREYKGWIISPKNVHGMYSAWKSGHTRLAADTLAGMRQIITHTENSGQ